MSSLNEIRIRAQEAQVSNILTAEYEDFHGFVPWDDKAPLKALVPQRYTVENRVVDNAEVQPNVAFNPATFLASSQIDFRLDSNDVSVIDHAFLVFSITNSTGGSVTLPPTPFWFDKIEIMSPNSNVLCTIRDIDNWQAICMLPRTEFEALAAYMGTTTAYATSGVAIANGASTELYLPLLTLFNAARIHLPGISGPITFRFSAKPSAMNLIAGTHPTFTKVVMLLNGFDEPQDKRNERTAFYRSRIAPFQQTPIYVPFFNWDHFSTGASLTASVICWNVLRSVRPRTCITTHRRESGNIHFARELQCC